MSLADGKHQSIQVELDCSAAISNKSCRKFCRCGLNTAPTSTLLVGVRKQSTEHRVDTLREWRVKGVTNPIATTPTGPRQRAGHREETAMREQPGIVYAGRFLSCPSSAGYVSPGGVEDARADIRLHAGNTYRRKVGRSPERRMTVRRSNQEPVGSCLRVGAERDGYFPPIFSFKCFAQASAELRFP